MPFRLSGVTELLKHRGVLPNLRQTLLVEIARQSRQVAAGINFTLIGNERHAGAGQTTFGHGLHAIRMARPRGPGMRMKVDSRRAGHGQIRGADLLPIAAKRGLRQRGSAALRRTALAHDAEVVRRAGGFQLDAAFLRAVVKPIQDFFVFVGRHRSLYSSSSCSIPSPFFHCGEIMKIELAR